MSQAEFEATVRSVVRGYTDPTSVGLSRHEKARTLRRIADDVEAGRL